MFVGYLLAPVAGWLAAGSLKFVINSSRAGRPAFGQIGYGGFPSTHTAIAAAPLTTLLFRVALDHPAVAVGSALLLLVVIDATSLRRKVGEHAAALNRLEPDRVPHRERMGHSLLEVVGGLLVGGACGVLIASTA